MSIDVVGNPRVCLQRLQADRRTEKNDGDFQDEMGCEMNAGFESARQPAGGSYDGTDQDRQNEVLEVAITEHPGLKYLRAIGRKRNDDRKKKPWDYGAATPHERLDR